jgi:predicted negative regulator of RcsB-dependent stress response
MAYDLEEQEQIALIKDWWRRYGRLLSAAVTVLLVGVIAVQGWRYYRGQQAATAATLYAQLDTADKTNEPKKVQEIAATLAGSQAGTAYASMRHRAAATGGRPMGRKKTG